MVAHFYVVLLYFSKRICICYFVWSLNDCKIDRTIVADETTIPERFNEVLETNSAE